MVCAARGYNFVAIMTETFSIERRKLMRAYGAKVILTAAAERGTGMVRRAEELAAKHGWFLARQFENQANPAYHRQTTAAEILRDFAGRRLDHFVSGWGTGGTLTGVADVLRVARPEVKVTVAEPAVASLLAGKEWSPHKIQGWTPDFVPAVLDPEAATRILTIDDVVARDTSLRLAREEGIFVGISAGATVAAALEVAQDANDGDVILAMLPDTGERYLSTFLLEGVEEGSDDAWLASLGCNIPARRCASRSLKATSPRSRSTRSPMPPTNRCSAVAAWTARSTARPGRGGSSKAARCRTCGSACSWEERRVGNEGIGRGRYWCTTMY